MLHYFLITFGNESFFHTFFLPYSTEMSLLSRKKYILFSWGEVSVPRYLQAFGVIFRSKISKLLVWIQELSIVSNSERPRKSHLALSCLWFLFMCPNVFFTTTISFFFVSDQHSLQFNCSKYHFPLLVLQGIQSSLSPTVAFFLSWLHQAEYLSSLNISFIAESSLYYWQNVNFFLINTHARLYCLLIKLAISRHKPVPLHVQVESLVRTNKIIIIVLNWFF